MKRIFTLFVVSTLAMAMLACSFGSSLLNTLDPTAAPTRTSAPQKATAKPGANEPTRSAVNPSATVPQALSTTQLDTLLPDLYEKINSGVVAILVVGEQGGDLGSGFVYDTKGNIVTNYHVVEGAKDLEVDFANGTKVRGTVVGTDLDSDLAVIKVDLPADQLNPLPLGDSDNVRVGQQVIAMGNPFGLNGTMTLGIISAKGRTLDSMRQSATGGYFSSGDIIQTDASINPGNSGGPLITLKGEVIGINRAIRTTGATATGEPVNSGIGFAVPINTVKRVVPVLARGDKYDYPYLGISFNSGMSLLDFEAVGSKQTSGAYVVDVTPGGPGDQAGLRAGKTRTSVSGLLAGGDIVIEVEGRQVQVFGDLIGYILENKSPGDKVTVTILRDNEKKEVVITLGKRP
jgi:2-alkenal reductase